MQDDTDNIHPCAGAFAAKNKALEKFVPRTWFVHNRWQGHTVPCSFGLQAWNSIVENHFCHKIDVLVRYVGALDHQLIGLTKGNLVKQEKFTNMEEVVKDRALIVDAAIACFIRT